MNKISLRRLCALPGILILALLFAFPAVSRAASSQTIPVTIKGVQDYEKAYEVLEYTNQVRKNLGLNELEMDQELLAVAMQRAAEIVLCTDHYRPDKTSCFTISDRLMAENIAAGQTSAQEVMNDWVNSSSHYKNIINSSYQSIGIGVLRVGTTYYWVQSFGTDSAVTVSQPSNCTVYPKINVNLSLAYKSIYVDLPDDNTLLVGSTKSLKLSWYCTVSSYETYRAATLYYRDFRLTSDNPDIVYPNSGGVIKGLKAGTATLTLESRTVSGFTEVAKITVKEASTTRTVKFNANGGYLTSGSSIASTLTSKVTNGKKYGTLPTPKRSGYTFAGWYTKKSGGTKVTSSSKVSITSGKTQTLYAHWKKVSVTRSSILKIKTTTGGRAALTWKAVSGASGYQILYSTTKKFTKSTRTSRSVSGTKTAAYISGLKSGKRYYIAVRAWKYDSCGNKVYGRYSVIRNFLYR